MVLILPEIVDLPALEAGYRDLVLGARDRKGLPIHFRIAGILVQPTHCFAVLGPDPIHRARAVHLLQPLESIRYFCNRKADKHHGGDQGELGGAHGLTVNRSLAAWTAFRVILARPGAEG